VVILAALLACPVEHRAIGKDDRGHRAFPRHGCPEIRPDCRADGSGL